MVHVWYKNFTLYPTEQPNRIQYNKKKKKKKKNHTLLLLGG